MKQNKLDFTYDGRRVVVFVEWEESTRLARELEKEESGRFLEALEWELETEEEQRRMESAIDAAEYRMADR
jgi:hypothetical protein